MASAGWVRVLQYASTSHGVENYYKLTTAGYRLLNGPKTPLPSRGFFRPVSLGLQEHTRALSDFIVHMLVSAHDAGIALLSFCRENDLRLTIGEERLLPDNAFQLGTEAGETFNFFVELDNGTEPVSSRKERESWQQKISFYDRFQDQCSYRFRVLIVCTRNRQRSNHIMQAAAQMLRNPQRRLFYAASLPRVLSTDNLVTEACFQDHLGKSQSLIPKPFPAAAASVAAQKLDHTPAFW